MLKVAHGFFQVLDQSVIAARVAAFHNERSVMSEIRKLHNLFRNGGSKLLKLWGKFEFVLRRCGGGPMRSKDEVYNFAGYAHCISIQCRFGHRGDFAT